MPSVTVMMEAMGTTDTTLTTQLAEFDSMAYLGSQRGTSPSTPAVWSEDDRRAQPIVAEGLST
jgi:hypothetical protein